MTLLAAFAESFPTDEPCGLWAAVQSSPHTDPREQKAVARAMVKDLLKENTPEYANSYHVEVDSLYSPGRPFAAYNIMLMLSMPKFAKRKSKKRTKTFLGWVHTFLTEAGETELLKKFEERIADHLSSK